MTFYRLNCVGVNSPHSYSRTKHVKLKMNCFIDLFILDMCKIIILPAMFYGRGNIYFHGGIR
jgi:hypothetical protein